MSRVLRSSGWLAIVAACLLSIVCANRLRAQVSTATIVGTVTDSSGAAIVGAMVQVKNAGTGITQRVATDGQGRYRVANLDIGNYELQVSNAGFQTVVRGGITLTVGSEPVVDFSLPVGQGQQTVTVESQVSAVETQSTAVGALVEGAQMRELPLNGRNYTQLVALEPGVTQIVAGAPAAGSSFAGNGVKYTISGSRPNNTSWLLDGEDLLGWWRNVPGAGGLGTALGVEAIAEFQVLTNTYSAQFGGNGAVINASSRSGTNTFHGSAFEFLRNDKLEARNFFDRDKPPAYRQNQFGASLGGAIKKDRIFFFGDYEGLRLSQTATNVITVPDPCAHQFLTSTVTPGVCGPAIPQAGTPFGTNAAVRQAITNTMALWPNTATNELLANGQPSGTGQTFALASTNGHQDYYLARLDYNISEKDAIFLRYVYDRANRTAPAATIPYWPEVDHSRGHYVQLQWRRILSPKLVNLARGGFDRPYEEADDIGSPTVANGVVTPGAPTAPGVHPLQFYGTSAGRVDGVISSFSGVNQLGPNCCLPFYMVPNRFAVGDDIIWTSGSHSVKFGGTATRFREDTFTVLFQTPMWIFPSLPAFETGTAVAVVGQVSDLQAPLSGKGSNRDWRYWMYSLYAEDQWKASRRLTVNIGLRYSPTSIISLARQSVYMLHNPFLPNQPWTPERQETESNPSLKNWDPRIGLAFDPFADHKTSIRAGFGMFHNVMHTSDLNSWFQPPLLFAQQTIAQGLLYPTPFSNIPAATNPNQVVIPTNGTLSINGNGQYWGIRSTAYQMQWNLSIQREIAPNTVASVAYIGTHYVHGVGQTDMNSPIPCVQSASQMPLGQPYILQGATGCFYNGAPTYSNASGVANPRIDPLYGFLLFGNTLSDAHYEALQPSLTRRFSHGLQSQVSYTFSKSIDNASGAFGPNGGGPASQAFNVAADRGLSNFDRRHNFRISAIYDISYRGKGVAGAILRGWELNGIFTYLSGYPSDPASGASRVYSGGTQGLPTSGRPNAVAGCDLYSGFHTLNQWFNPSCFSLQALGTYGNAGRDTIIGPNLWNLDNSLNREFRVTKISEGFRIQFRAEAFNILNHPSFQNPNTTIFAGTTLNASAGQITGTTSAPRQIQFGLKLLF